MTATKGRDEIFPDAVMFGHIGNSYGLISDSVIDPVNEFGVVWITNGPKIGSDFKNSNKTAFLKPELESFDVIH